LLAAWLPVQIPCFPALTSLAHHDTAEHGASVSWDHGHLHVVVEHIDESAAEPGSPAQVGPSVGDHDGHDHHVFHLGSAEWMVRIDSQDSFLTGPSLALVAFASPTSARRSHATPMRPRVPIRANASTAHLRTTILLV
jgi:hypothetical protein